MARKSRKTRVLCACSLAVALFSATGPRLAAEISPAKAAGAEEGVGKIGQVGKGEGVDAVVLKTRLAKARLDLCLASAQARTTASADCPLATAKDRASSSESKNEARSAADSTPRLVKNAVKGPNWPGAEGGTNNLVEDAVVEDEGADEMGASAAPRSAW